MSFSSTYAPPCTDAHIYGTNKIGSIFSLVFSSNLPKLATAGYFISQLIQNCRRRGCTYVRFAQWRRNGEHGVTRTDTDLAPPLWTKINEYVTDWGNRGSSDTRVHPGSLVFLCSKTFVRFFLFYLLVHYGDHYVPCVSRKPRNQQYLKSYNVLNTTIRRYFTDPVVNHYRVISNFSRSPLTFTRHWGAFFVIRFCSSIIFFRYFRRRSDRDNVDTSCFFLTIHKHHYVLLYKHGRLYEIVRLVHGLLILHPLNRKL
jgi:hypothetical protein